MPPSPLHYATYFDRHYLTRGLALYRSLARHSPPFRLWALCLDDATYGVLTRLRLDGVELISLAELERADPALRDARPTRRLYEYYWTIGPAFLSHLFQRRREIGLLTYLDADLFFFGDPEPIYRELGGGDILIIEHRWAPQVNPAHLGKGRFQVGLVLFRRTDSALACLRRWREQCLEWCFDRLEPGRFGDQKYLEEWPSRCGQVVVSQHKGAALGSNNIGNYRYRYELGKVWVDEDPLIFYHFTRLRVVTRWLYDPGIWGHNRGLRLDPILRRHVYVPYARELRAARALVLGVGGRLPRSDSLRWSGNRFGLLARMLRHRSFLLVTDAFAL